jgi:hypothetical protein
MRQIFEHNGLKIEITGKNLQSVSEKTEALEVEVKRERERARQSDFDFQRACIFGGSILGHVESALGEIRRQTKPDTETVVAIVALEQKVAEARYQFEIGLGPGKESEGDVEDDD